MSAPQGAEHGRTPLLRAETLDGSAYVCALHVNLHVRSAETVSVISVHSPYA